MKSRMWKAYLVSLLDDIKFHYVIIFFIVVNKENSKNIFLFAVYLFCYVFLCVLIISRRSSFTPFETEKIVNLGRYFKEKDRKTISFIFKFAKH